MPSTTPTDLPNLQSWIASSPPYHNINHTTTPFIDVNDFTSHELEVALCYAIKIYEGEQEELKSELREAQARGSASENVLSHASRILEWASTGPIAQIPPQDFQQMAIAAKFADDLTYQNCVVGLAVGIRKLKEEIVKLRQDGKEKEGDEDDWFLVGREEGEERKQERLFAEIEIQLDLGGGVKREEGEIEVGFARP